VLRLRVAFEQEAQPAVLGTAFIPRSYRLHAPRATIQRSQELADTDCDNFPLSFGEDVVNRSVSAIHHIFLLLVLCCSLAFGRELGPGTHDFVDQVFVGETIDIDGTRFVHLESTTSRFVRCVFENSIVRARESVVVFEDCEFRDTAETVVLAEDCRVDVRGCRFERCAEAVNLIRCTGRVSESSFRQIRFGADAIDIDFDPVVPAPGWTPVAVLSNVIDQCSGDGIDLGSSQARVAWNQIANCADKGISIGEGSSGDIHDNVVQNARIGIAIKDGANPVCRDNTLGHCRFGIRVYEKENGAGGAFGELVGNRFYQCRTRVEADLRSLPHERGSVLLATAPMLPPDIPTLHTNPPPVVINEIAHRSVNPAYREFVELHNPGPVPVDLSGWAIVDEVYHAFAPGTLLAPGGYLHVRFPADSLDDDVLVMRVVDQHQTDVDTVEVFRTGSWPRGDMPLELLSPERDNNQGTHWENSAAETGTPGRANSRSERVVEAFTGAPVVISELMYHPPNETDEFVELLNHGDSTIDLGGWTFSEGIIEQIPFGTFLGSGKSLLVAAPFDDRRLSNRGERIDLRDRFGGLVDRVDYLDRGVWPRQADGEGASLALRSPRLDNNRAESWVAQTPSPGTANAVTNHADVTVHALAHRPVQPDPGEAIEVHVRTDGVPRLQWRLDPTPEWTETTFVRVDASDTNTIRRWIAPIPGQATESVVIYRVVAQDAEGLERISASQLLRVREPVERAELDLLLTQATETELRFRPTSSNVLLPATLVAGRQIFQGARVRLRGLTKREWPVKSYRIDLRDDHPFAGEDRLNLNGKRPLTEAFAYQVFHREGFRSPRIELLDTTIGRANALPFALTERQYPGEASEGWPADLDLQDRIALAGQLEGGDTDAVDVRNWVDWFALTAVLGDAQSLLNGVDGNHAVEQGSGGALQLQPLDLDITFASQLPRGPTSFENTRLHPPAAEAGDLPARFLRVPTIQRDYYERILELIDERLRQPSFEQAADTLFAGRPFSFQDTRGQMQQYLDRDLAWIEDQIEALLKQSGWEPRLAPARPNPVELPFAQFWLYGTMALPDQTLLIDGEPFPDLVQGTNWCFDVGLFATDGPGRFSATAELSAMPLLRRPWTTGTQSVEIVHDGRDPDGNGLTTSWENYFGVSDARGDPDGDGLTNLREFELGSDPRVESVPRLELVRTATGFSLVLQGGGPVAGPVRLERGFPWRDSDPFPDGGYQIDQTEIDARAPLQLFRLRLPDSAVLPLQKPFPAP